MTSGNPDPVFSPRITHQVAGSTHSSRLPISRPSRIRNVHSLVGAAAVQALDQDSDPLTETSIANASWPAGATPSVFKGSGPRGCANSTHHAPFSRCRAQALLALLSSIRSLASSRPGIRVQLPPMAEMPSSNATLFPKPSASQIRARRLPDRFCGIRFSCHAADNLSARSYREAISSNGKTNSEMKCLGVRMRLPGGCFQSSGLSGAAHDERNAERRTAKNAATRKTRKGAFAQAEVRGSVSPNRSSVPRY